MAFAETLTERKPKTASDHYTNWLNKLPAAERAYVEEAMRDMHEFSHARLKKIVETDPDNPAPKYGLTAFREWRSEHIS